MADVIQATFSDFKLIKTRGVAQLVFEVPAERSLHALQLLGGLPSPTIEAHVAIVRLQHPLATKEPDMPDTPEKEGRDAVIQAALRAREPDFQLWILGPRFQVGDPAVNEAAAAGEIRKQLGITSRGELKGNADARAEWKAMVARFEAQRPSSEGEGG